MLGLESPFFSVPSAAFPPFFAREKEIHAREGFSASPYHGSPFLFGALPFFRQRAIPNFVDCILKRFPVSPPPAPVFSLMGGHAHGAALLAKLTHWLGGMGVLVFLLAIIPMMKGKSTMVHLPGRSWASVKSWRLSFTKRPRLYGIYIALTMVQILILFWRSECLCLTV